MAHTWFVIDKNGQHAVGREKMNFWQKFDYSGSDSEWPEFTQLVVDATIENVSKAMHTVAKTRGWRCEEITDHPEDWEGGLLVAENGSALCLTEAGVDLDERRLDAGVAENIAGLLACDAAFFGHDTSTGLIHISRFDLGAPELAWFDSTSPGPSVARTFHRNGQCTDEDPRAYALRNLNMPETSPLLDRYAFVHSILQKLGIDRVEPELSNFPVVRVFQLIESEDA